MYAEVGRGGPTRGSEFSFRPFNSARAYRRAAVAAHWQMSARPVKPSSCFVVVAAAAGGSGAGILLPCWGRGGSFCDTKKERERESGKASRMV